MKVRLKVNTVVKGISYKKGEIIEVSVKEYEQNKQKYIKVLEPNFKKPVTK